MKTQQDMVTKYVHGSDGVVSITVDTELVLTPGGMSVPLFAKNSAKDITSTDKRQTFTALFVKPFAELSESECW